MPLLWYRHQRQPQWQRAGPLISAPHAAPSAHHLPEATVGAQGGDSQACQAQTKGTALWCVRSTLLGQFWAHDAAAGAHVAHPALATYVMQPLELREETVRRAKCRPKALYPDMCAQQCEASSVHGHTIGATEHQLLSTSCRRLQCCGS